MLGSTPSGLSEGPLSWVWPSLPHLVSTVWNSDGNCLEGFPSASSVGCGLPYHIWSLLSGSLLATASRVFRVPPRSGVAFPTTSGLYCVEVCWQLPRGFSECLLGWVWPSLPHLVSTVWKSAGNCPGTQTQLS